MPITIGVMLAATVVTILAIGVMPISIGVMRVVIGVALGAIGAMSAVMAVTYAAIAATSEETAVSPLPVDGLELPSGVSGNRTGVFRVITEEAPGSGETGADSGACDGARRQPPGAERPYPEPASRSGGCWV
jgi:hypothetical protein